MQALDQELALNLRRLRLRHLEILLAVERHGSLTATADALGVSQPAVSQWLAEIESALGVPLFVRGRQIQPSPYLPVALRHARRMVADSHQLQQELKAVAAGTLGVVRIGAMPVVSVALLPAAIRSIKAASEPLQIDVVEDIALGLWARFERRELDVILGRLDERAFGREVRSESLFKDPHRVVVGCAHPLVSAPRVDWPSAASHPWILPPANTALRRAIDSTFLDRGLPVPLPWIESASGTLLQVLMSQTDCVGVMSGAAARRYRQQGALAILPLRLKYDVGPVGMIWDAQEPSPALERVLEAVRQAVPEATRKSSAPA